MSTLQQTQPESELQTAIQRFETAFGQLFQLIDTYPVDKREASGACGVWSPKQVLDHFSGWIVEANHRYDQFDAGEKASKTYEFDFFNAGSVDARAGQSWETSVSELQERVSGLQARAEVINAESSSANRYAGWLHELAVDCEEHTEQLRDFITEA